MEPERIGRYEIKSEIGRGGMATVYLAYDPRFKREVAIKVLPSQFLHDPTFRARFEREAMTIAAIEHPGIVPVYDYGEENGQPYLVMRYMHGGSLSDVLQKGPLSFRETAHIITQLAPALDEMHSRGIIHRDLKPGNILFDHYGNACISDFGIARLTEATTTLTGDALIGTPSYMSPEQARGDTDIDGRSDIYALGAILFEMLTGKQPYQATTPMGVVMKHITEPVPRILEVRSDLPLGTENVITRAMAKKRDERFQTARDLAAAQEAVIRQQTSRQVAPTTVKKVDLPPVTEKPAREAVQKPPQPVIAPEKPPVEQKPLEKPAQVPPPIIRRTDQPQRQEKSPAPAVGQAPPVSHPPVGGRPAGHAAAQAYPLPAQPHVSAEQTPRPRRWIWALGAVAVVILLCGVASALGIPSLLAALSPGAATPTDTLSELTPGSSTQPAEPGATIEPVKTIDVFVDNFDNPESGWDRRETDESITNYEAGYYRILVNRPTTFNWANPGLHFADVTMEVEATKTAGPDRNFFGLLCRYQDPYNFYILAISSDGYYSIRKYLNGDFYYLGDTEQWEFSGQIRQGETPNVIRADCIGDTLKLYANGTLLAEAQDSSFQHGDVGLTAASLEEAGTNILFDSFVAAKP